MTAWSLLLGLALGVGAWVTVAALPVMRRPRLAARIAPYLLDVSVEAREFVARRPADPLPVVGVVAAPAFSAGRRAIGAVFGGDATVAARQRQAGIPVAVEAHRSRQLAAAAIGAASGVVVAVALTAVRDAPAVVMLVTPVLGAAAGVLAVDQLLARRARARLRRVEAELPVVLEFLTLSLSAGEGVLDAVRRVSRIGRGDLAAELRLVLADVHAGTPLVDALTTSARGLDLAAWNRAVTQLVAALDRGSPLADVLRAQAQDARDDARRGLLETAGKKEVAMLVPLVFLILPVTVFFAVFPGVMVLRLDG